MNHDSRLTYPQLLDAVLFAVNITGIAMVFAVQELRYDMSRAIPIVSRAVILGLSLTMLFLAVMKKVRYQAGWPWFLVMYFWCIYSFRVVSDLWLTPVQIGKSPVEFVAFAYGISLIPMLAMSVEHSRNALKLGVTIIALLGAMSIIIFLLSSGDPFSRKVQGRFMTEKMNPIALGHLGATVALVCINQIIISQKQRFFYLSCMTIGLLAIVVTASKGPIIAFTISVVFLVSGAFKKGQRLKIFLGMALLAVITTISLIYLKESYVNVIMSRFEKSYYIEDASAYERIHMMQAALDIFISNPVFGGYIEAPGAGIYPHNILIEGLMATGILGGIPLIIIFSLGLRYSFGIIKHLQEERWVALLSVQYAVGVMFSGSIYGSNMYWVMLMAVFSIQQARLAGSEPNQSCRR